MRIIYLLILTMLSLTLPFFMKKEFKLPPVYENIPPYNPKWEFPTPTNEILELLNQRFTYFANGNQSTVFLSQDEKYVLKLFRYSRSRFSLIHNFKNFFKKKPKMNLLTKINKTLNAAYLGCTEAKEFTQAIYCHLNLSVGQLPSTQFELKNKTIQLPMDRYRFVIQKKVATFKEALIDARNDPEKMNRLMHSFATLLLKRSSLNIRNSDPNLGPNFGFLEGKAVELDFGNYHKISPDLLKRIEEYDNLMNRFEVWVKKYTPEYFEDLKHLRLNVRSSYDATQ